MFLAYIVKLGLISQKIIVKPKKIDSSTLKIYGMIIILFLLQDSFKTIILFKRAFLLINTSMKIIIGMFFLFFNNIDFKFIRQEKLA